MTEILINLHEFKKVSDNAKRKHKNFETVVIETGYTYFDNSFEIDFEKSKTYTAKVPEILVNATKEKKLKYVAKLFEKDEVQLTIAQVKFVPPNSKRLWSMSIKDYAQMIKDGRKVNILLKKLKK
jgi:hypothetical protein